MSLTNKLLVSLPLLVMGGLNGLILVEGFMFYCVFTAILCPPIPKRRRRYNVVYQEGSCWCSQRSC